MSTSRLTNEVVPSSSDDDGAEWWHPPSLSGSILQSLRAHVSWPQAIGGVAETIGDELGASSWEVWLPDEEDAWLHRLPRVHAGGDGRLFDEGSSRVPLDASARRHLETPGVRVLPCLQARPRDGLLEAGNRGALPANAAMVMSIGVEDHRLGCIVWYFPTHDRIPRGLGRVLAELPVWIATCWGLASRLRRAIAERSEAIEASRILAIARGAAHDLDNVLFSLRCRIETLSTLPLEPTALEHLAAISTGHERLRELARSLRRRLDHEEEPAADGEATDLVEWWRRREATFRAIVPAAISMLAIIAPGTPPVAIPEEDLTQVVSNLVINAAKALGAEGSVVISALEINGSRQVRLTVADDGPGMDAAALDRLRSDWNAPREVEEVEEPPRREPPRDEEASIPPSGLGLRIVRRLLDRCGGDLILESIPGQGTRASLLLPAAMGPSRPLVAAVAAKERVRRLMLAELLRESGFESVRLADADSPVPEKVSLIVAEEGSAIAAKVRSILDARAGAIAVLLGAREDGGHPRVRCVSGDGSPDAIRRELHEIRRSLDRPERDRGATTTAAG